MRRVVSRANRGLLTIFAVLMAIATVIAAYEIFLVLPECPDGADNCMLRAGHWRGSKLVAAILLAAWILAAVWLLASRRIARRNGSPYPLMLFWLLPAFVLANILPILL